MIKKKERERGKGKTKKDFYFFRPPKIKKFVKKNVPKMHSGSVKCGNPKLVSLNNFIKKYNYYGLQ